jgi:hypothetical protein
MGISDTADTKLDYTEVYSYDEAIKVIEEKQPTSADALKEAVKIAFSQTNKPEKIAIVEVAGKCGSDSVTVEEADTKAMLESAKKIMSNDFRYLIMACNGAYNLDHFKALSEYIETRDDKILIFDYPENNYDEFSKTLTKAERSFVLVSATVVDKKGNPTLNPTNAGLFANLNSKSVGSYTYKNQVVQGTHPIEDIDKTMLQSYHNVNVNMFVTKAGYNVTSEGKTLSGEYLDIVDTKDWLIAQIKYQLQQTLIINDKIPYDNNGIAVLESVVVNILKDAYNNGMIATDDDGTPAFTVNFAKRSETSASDREKRQYVEGRFSFELAGAIHTVVINGTINI